MSPHTAWVRHTQHRLRFEHFVTISELRLLRQLWGARGTSDVCGLWGVIPQVALRVDRLDGTGTRILSNGPRSVFVRRSVVTGNLYRF